MREDRSEILNRIAATTACEPEQVREIVRLALEALHKIAFCDERCLTGSLMECYWIFGEGACYHLGGILEEARIFHDSDIPYSEFLQRFAPNSCQACHRLSFLLGDSRHLMSGNRSWQAELFSCCHGLHRCSPSICGGLQDLR